MSAMQSAIEDCSRCARAISSSPLLEVARFTRRSASRRRRASRIAPPARAPAARVGEQRDRARSSGRTGPSAGNAPRGIPAARRFTIARRSSASASRLRAAPPPRAAGCARCRGNRTRCPARADGLDERRVERNALVALPQKELTDPARAARAGEIELGKQGGRVRLVAGRPAGDRPSELEEVADLIEPGRRARRQQGARPDQDAVALRRSGQLNGDDLERVSRLVAEDAADDPGGSGEPPQDALPSSRDRAIIPAARAG